MSAHLYETSHPWISFRFDLRQLSYPTWLLLGEAMSKCSHVAGTPLQPDVAQDLHAVYVSKGVHATTAIEGNTLSEAEVRDRIENGRALPKSREYLGRDVDNIVSVSNSLISDVIANPQLELSAERICDYNRRVLDGLPLSDNVVPGTIRTHSVTVGSYRGAPAEDCAYLLDRLAGWLNDMKAPVDRPELTFPVATLKAILAHLYLAWIHPFGDGNGRTARIIEFQLMIQAGAPLPTAHLLSDHYNRTRSAYYTELERTSRRDGYPVEPFIQYALQGFVDELREQIDTIRLQQHEVTWRNLIHDNYRDEETPAKTRQRHLILDMKPGQWYERSRIGEISPRIAADYAGKEPKTVSRDLNELQRRDLIARDGSRFRARWEVIAAFLPVVAGIDSAYSG